jgi:hypothetical protein
MAEQHTPIRLTTRPKTDAPEDTVVLFYIDDVPYRVPRKTRVNLALQVVDDMEVYGAGVAELRMLRRAIGDDAYRALANHDDLEQGQLMDIARVVTQGTLGALEDDGTTPEPEEDGVDRGNSGGSATAEPSPAA